MTAAAWPPLERLLWQARASAFPRGEFVGQGSFVSASEIQWLAPVRVARRSIAQQGAFPPRA